MMRQNHVAQVARIHHDALPADFLPSLGLPFLEKVFFRAALTSEYGKTFVYTDKDKVAGFITIAHDSPAFIRNIFLSNLPQIVWTFLTKVLLNVALLVESLSLLSSLRDAGEKTTKSEIVLIAVDKEYRGKGIGSELIKEAMSYIRTRGYTCCRVKTLAQNTDAIAVYRKNGFETRRTLTLAGKKYLIMVNEGN